MKKLNIFIAGAAATMMLAATSSCVGDLDLIPNDPNSVNEVNSATLPNILAKCYSGLAVEGQNGPGSCDIAGIDGGRSQYLRAIYMMNEFPTDEVKWKWPDDGIVDLNTLTFDASNGNIYGTYSRFYSHIAVCNDFLRSAKEFGGPEYAHAMLEARLLRAMSYYWVIDIFGQGGFVTENDEIGSNPPQWSRIDLYNWLADELESIITEFKTNYAGEEVEYGKVGIDAAQALAARLYLNAGVYTGTPAYDKCQAHCEDIIARHKGGGFNNSGLAKNYLYLFCRDNDEYAPGGGNKAENEILWNVPYDNDMCRSYGGTFFIIAASTTTSTTFDPATDAPGVEDKYNMSAADYGCNAPWTCMRSTGAFTSQFDPEVDGRCAMWLRESNGFSQFIEKFTVFNQGYATIKFTSLLKGTDGDWSTANGGSYDPTGQTPANLLNWSSTDFPLIRLADVYLMYTEGYVMGGSGSSAKAVEYVNYVRQRAGLNAWSVADLTPDNILSERSRELYWELTRRSDLIRHNKFTQGYNWEFKGNVAGGTDVDSRYNLMPVPAKIIAAQPEFKQNPGYSF